MVFAIDVAVYLVLTRIIIMMLERLWSQVNAGPQKQREREKLTRVKASTFIWETVLIYTLDCYWLSVAFYYKINGLRGLWHRDARHWAQSSHLTGPLLRADENREIHKRYHIDFHCIISICILTCIYIVPVCYYLTVQWKNTIFNGKKRTQSYPIVSFLLMARIMHLCTFIDICIIIYFYSIIRTYRFHWMGCFVVNAIAMRQNVWSLHFKAVFFLFI